jgi:hypothetical protein
MYVFGSETSFMIAYDHSVGIRNDFYFKIMLISTLYHVIILVTSIWTFGWVIGIILFIMHITSVIHALLGWIVSLPSLFTLAKVISTQDAQSIYVHWKQQHQHRIISFIMIACVGFIFMLINLSIHEFKWFLLRYEDVLNTHFILIMIVSMIVIVVIKKIIESRLKKIETM